LQRKSVRCVFTGNLSLPPLQDSQPLKTWAALFDPNPHHWSWGAHNLNGPTDDQYTGRGIYLCGYFDVPLDYLNHSDPRIARLAVPKFQVSGLSRIGSHGSTLTSGKSKRTIVVEPGGPGASGTLQVWQEGETITERFSSGQFDVFGWGPRGVNSSLPTASCYPHVENIHHWSLLTGQYRETSEPDPVRQLKIADAMNNATFYACRQRLGDFGRFVTTASVVRDLAEIRKALNKEELTAYFVSYGTGIGQTYANMFPNSVGRMILDGPQYVKDQRLLGGWGWKSLNNVTNLWHDGFLGECVKSGPQKYALASGRQGGSATLEELESRMGTLLHSVLANPVAGYTESDGPTLITYSELVVQIYVSLYEPSTWPATAQMLYELEAGNSTLAAAALGLRWTHASSTPSAIEKHPSDELPHLVICADAYDAPTPEGGLVWWDHLWADMTHRSWISGNFRFLSVFPCRHLKTYWPDAAEVYCGDVNHTLKNPILIIGVT